jgi:hypothetical protein
MAVEAGATVAVVGDKEVAASTATAVIATATAVADTVEAVSASESNVARAAGCGSLLAMGNQTTLFSAT